MGLNNALLFSPKFIAGAVGAIINRPFFEEIF